MPEIWNRRKQFFRANSFKYDFSVLASSTTARQEPFDCDARIKNEALSGHVARRGLP